MSQRSNHEIQFRSGIAALASALAIVSVMLIVQPARAQDTDSLSLHQAVALALQNSRDVKLAQVQYSVALGEVHVAKAEFLPNLYTGSGLAYTHGFPALPGGQPPSIFELDYTEAFFNPLLKGQQHAAEDPPLPARPPRGHLPRSQAHARRHRRRARPLLGQYVGCL